MDNCKHKWVFQETQKKRKLENDSGTYTAHFHRIDVYYCEKCCKVKKAEQKESVKLPFGGTCHLSTYAPIWY